jgi:hypothetical protein
VITYADEEDIRYKTGVCIAINMLELVPGVRKEHILRMPAQDLYILLENEIGFRWDTRKTMWICD